MKGNHGSRKILMIGLDGLDPEFLERHLDELPVLKSLIEGGASGKLRSTIPPFSLAAWPAAMSGMNPSRIGVTCLPEDDFNWSVPPLNSQSVRVPLIWDVAGLNDKKVAVVNVPLTYPPSPVNGFMISGFLTPNQATDFTYPPELRQELSPGYETSLDFMQHEVDRDYFLKHLYRLTREQFDNVEELIKKKPWDLFIYVVSGTDWIQHYFCKDHGLPGWEEAESIMLEYFRQVDSFLGRLRRSVDPSTAIVILSDHGFGKVPSRFIYLNHWLEEKDYLTFRGSLTGSIRNYLACHLRSLGKFRLLSALKPRLPAKIRGGFHHLTRLTREQIEWGKTRAYFYLFMQHTGYIRIVKKGLSPGAVVALKEQILSDLHELNDLHPEGRIFNRIYTREEVFKGGSLDGIPDILLIFEPEWLGQTGASSALIQEIPLGGRPNATHRMDGVYILNGPEIIPGHRTDLEITDITPTIYHMMSLPLPSETDGRVAMECFRSQSSPGSTEIAYRHYDRIVGKTVEWEKKDQEDVKQKLHALGYL